MATIADVLNKLDDVLEKIEDNKEKLGELEANMNADKILSAICPHCQGDGIKENIPCPDCGNAGIRPYGKLVKE